MLSRREFIGLAGLGIASLFGAPGAIALAKELAPDARGEYTVVTDLKFIDAEELNAVMARIEAFGGPEKSRALGDSVMTKDMTLEAFVDRYLAGIEKACPGRKVIATGKECTPADMVGYACHAELLFGLISSVVMEAGTTAFEALMRYHSHTFGAEELAYCGNVQGMYKALSRLQGRDTPDGWVLIKGGKSRERELREAFTGHRETFEIVDLTPLMEVLSRQIGPEGKATSFQPWYAREQAGICRHQVPQFLTVETGRWKGIHGKYELIRSFEKHRARLGGRDGSFTGNTVTGNPETLVAGILTGMLFIELALARMKMLSRQSQSGIFNGTDRMALGHELLSLSRAVDVFAEKTRYAGKPLLDGTWSPGPLVLKSAGKTASLDIPSMKTGALGIGGAGALTVGSPAMAIQTHDRVGKALDTVSSRRAKIIEAVKGL